MKTNITRAFSVILMLLITSISYSILSDTDLRTATGLYTNMAPLSLSAQAFHYRFLQGQLSPLSPRDLKFQSALDLEFRSDLFYNFTNDNSGETASLYARAISSYARLTQDLRYKDELPFIHLRLSACSFKQGNYSQANWHLSQSALNGGVADTYSRQEWAYYRSLTAAYFKKNIKEALRYWDTLRPEFFTFLGLDRTAHSAVRASFLALNGDTNGAVRTYEEIMRLDPAGLRARYNPTALFLSAGRTDLARRFAMDGISMFTNTADQVLREQSYRDLLLVHQTERRETIIIPLITGGSFPIFNSNLVTLMGIPGFQGSRELSSGIAIPLREQRQSRYDEVYTTLQENYIETQSGSQIMLAMGVIASNLIMNPFGSETIPYITRYSITNIRVLLVTPSNHISLNKDRPFFTNISGGRTNILTNFNTNTQSNLVYMTNFSFYNLYSTASADINGDNAWDHVFVGYQNNGLFTVSVFYPDLRRLEQVSFRPRNPNPTLAFMETGTNSSLQCLLFDKGVTLLPFGAAPLTNRPVTNIQTNRPSAATNR